MTAAGRRTAYVLGVGMTRFGRHVDRSMKSIGGEAVAGALEDATVGVDAVQAAFVGNAVQGLITGQECVRGQIVLRECGLGGIPMVNVENACASASSALHLAWQAVAGGFEDCVLALGMEKLYHPDKTKSFAALAGAVDVELLAQLKEALGAAGAPERSGNGGGEKRSLFMDVYAAAARSHMARYGTTVAQFAGVAAKNSVHGSLNPRAQYQTPHTVEDLLASPMIASPLTRLMCSPIGDGAAAAIVVSEDFLEHLRRRGGTVPQPIRIAASVLGTGRDRRADEPDPVTEAARRAYEQAGLGPEDEPRRDPDATAPAELMIYEAGFCPEAGAAGGRRGRHGARRAEAGQHLRRLIAKGHPVGATGLARSSGGRPAPQARRTRQVAGAPSASPSTGGACGDPAAVCIPCHGVMAMESSP
jgi:acetyl-CoA acetyltransferase